MIQNFKRFPLQKIILISFMISSLWITEVHSQSIPIPLKKHQWSFAGPFGVFKRDQLKRGFQVYKEVCSSCHGLNLLRYEKLEAIGFSKKEIKAIAGESEISGPLNDDGEPTLIKASPRNYFVDPYPNSVVARSVNNGSFPPDLSLITKARDHGVDYVFSLLTGYKKAPDDFDSSNNMNYNPYFMGQQTAMTPPLSEGLIDYKDGTKATIAQMSEDVSAFLSWAAEPELEIRRNLGVKIMIFLFFFTILMYCLMYRARRNIKRRIG